MFSALFLAIQQLADKRIRSVVVRAVVVSAVVFIALVFGISWTLSSTSFFGMKWLDSGVAILGGATAFAIGLLIFPALTGLVISFMMEEIARAVETRHFPDLPDVREEPIWEMVSHAARFASIALGLNLLVLVFVVPVLLFTFVLAPLIPFVFCALNGYLLGREYFEFAALRRLDPAAMQLLRRRHKTRILICGIVISVLMAIPLVNWLMPVVAAAYMVHVFEHARRSN
ncbi:MAG: EI24 domain-containing protein [Pseudomonadota bacterium]|nr:EI24 domain-containing protein [Pseudomonadota bacterium]